MNWKVKFRSTFQIIQFNNDMNVQKLENLYHSKSFSEIIGVSRKEPNFNADVSKESKFDDLEQEKIEVPAFLRRQAN